MKNDLFSHWRSQSLLLVFIAFLLLSACARMTSPELVQTEFDIHASIESGNAAEVKEFLAQGHDVNAIYDQGYTLLFYAIKHDKTDQVAKFLLTEGADPNLDTNGRTPLMYAVKYHNYPVMQALLEKNAEVNYIGKTKQSALRYAIESADVTALSMLVENGADLEQKIKGQKSAIELAKINNDQEVLEFLNLPYVPWSDGPYVFKQQAGQQAIWVCQGTKIAQMFSLKLPQELHHCGLGAKLWQASLMAEQELEYSGDFKVAAASDIHGQFELFLQLLKNNHIVDQNGKWSFGNGHFVITGDVFDRGPHVTEALWFIYDLQQQAKQHGGQVHMLLGNHEVMVLNGDLRYLNPKYIETSDQINRPYNELFAVGSVLGDWLRSLPVAVKVNDILFAHGGFHPDLVSKNLSLQQINKTFKAQLVVNELVDNGRDELGTYLHKSNGIIWYRGYFREPRASEQEIDQLLRHFEVDHIVVGHTTFKHIESHYAGKVIAIDASMKTGETAEILLWQAGEFTRGTAAGEILPLLPQ